MKGLLMLLNVSWAELSEESDIAPLEIFVALLCVAERWGSRQTLMTVAASTDSMITDPVYEGKSMAGMIQLIKEGGIKEGSNVLYIHLGGQPALNAYSSYFPHN